MDRSEEHTSEHQSHSDLVCRLLLEKKNMCKQPHQYVVDKHCSQELRVNHALSIILLSVERTALTWLTV